MPCDSQSDCELKKAPSIEQPGSHRILRQPSAREVAGLVAQANSGRALKSQYVRFCTEKDGKLQVG
jgi:hypothetical protein